MTGLSIVSFYEVILREYFLNMNLPSKKWWAGTERWGLRERRRQCSPMLTISFE